MGQCFLHGNNKAVSEKSSVVVTAPAGSSVSLASAGGYGKTRSVKTKNLLDIDAYKSKVGTQAVNGAVTWFDDGLWLQSSGSDCYTNYGPTFFTISAKPNTKYTISWDLTGSEKLTGIVYAFVYNSGNSQIGSYNAVNTAEKLTFTTPEGTAKFSFRFGVQTAGQNAMYSNIQIEEGEKTSYVRYNSCEFRNVPNGWCLATATKGSEKAETSQFISRKDIYYFTLSFFKATISVTYPAGSTCTCSKDGKVLTAPDTSGRYDFVVDSAGDWTVACTDGAGKQDTKIANISSNGQTVSVTLQYTIVLYEAGVLHPEVTGEWIKNLSDLTIEFTTSGIVFGDAVGSTNKGAMSTTNKIDFTNYTRLVVVGNISSGNTNMTFGVCSNNNAQNLSFVASMKATQNGGTVDISSVNGAYYFGFVLSYVVQGTVTKIYVE